MSPADPKSLPKIAVCASGEGSNFQALVEATRSGVLRAEIVGLITNRGKIGAIGRAHRLVVPNRVLRPADFSSRAAWDRAMADQLKLWGAEWVVLAGFLTVIGPEVLKSFPRRIVNTHPSLLPKYGGHGMYGERVHEAVLAAREVETGITFHLVDEEYDRGEILRQCKIDISPGETVTSLSQRIKAEENRIFPAFLNDLIHRRS